MSTSTTRRDFLKNAGILATAAAAAQMAPAVHAASDSTIQLALIGCGGRGSGAVGDALTAAGGTVAPGPVKLVAMGDLFADRLASSHKNLSDAFGDKIDVPKDRQFVGFDAYKKAIDCLKPGDIALCTTHAAFRPVHFEYAVSKGVNVFMEKSFAVDSPAVRRMMKSAAEADTKNLKVSVGFMWRHSKARQEVIQRIHDGAIGDVNLLRIYRVHGPNLCGKKPAAMNEIEFQIRSATCFSWVSSGFLIDWHCHNIDVACWAKGAWPVTAQGFGGRTNPAAGEQFDHYTVEFTFPDGTKLMEFARHMSGCWETYSDFAHGTKGSAVIMTDLGDAKPKIYKGQNIAPADLVWDYGKPDYNPYVAEWDVLLDAVRNNKPHNEAKRACQSQIAGIMGRAAANTGQMITWDQAMNSNFQFVADIDHLNFNTPAPVTPLPDGGYAAPVPGLTKEI
jgi:predicted dehydrogenase